MRAITTLYNWDTAESDNAFQSFGLDVRYSSMLFRNNDNSVKSEYIYGSISLNLIQFIQDNKNKQTLKVVLPKSISGSSWWNIISKKGY